MILAGGGFVSRAAAGRPSGGTTVKSYLEQQADGLSAGNYVQLTEMGGLAWSLVDAGANENHMEYGHKAVYDPVRKKIRYVGGPHRIAALGGRMAVLEYDVETNEWSTATVPPDPAFEDNEGHGYDHNAVDPVTGYSYARAPGSVEFWKWNGSAWSQTADNDVTLTSLGQIAIGMTWDDDRGGLITWDEDGGVGFYDPDTNDWTKLANTVGQAAMGSYHHAAAFHPPSGLVWLQGANGVDRHWRLNTNNTITEQATAPITLGSSGSSGRFSAYDYRTEKFVVADPFTAAFREYDIVNDSWTSAADKVPLNCPDSSNVEGFVCSISDFGGVLLYVMFNSIGTAPRAYLYKHG